MSVAVHIRAAHCGRLLDHHAHDYLSRRDEPCRCNGTMRGQRTVIYIRSPRYPGAVMSPEARLRRAAERWGEEI